MNIGKKSHTGLALDAVKRCTFMISYRIAKEL